MDADFLKNDLHFKEGLKNSYYKKIDGFLYTVSIADENEIFLFVNLPQTDDSFKKDFADFLKENVKKLLKERVVKNGFKLTFSADAFQKKNYIVKVAQQISEHLTSLGITFGEEKHEISFKNNMYVFDIDETVDTPQLTEEIAEEIIPEVASEEISSEDVTQEKVSFFDKIPTQILLIAIYLLCAVLFLLLSLISVNVAAASGYFMGWLATMVLVKRKKKNSTVFITVTVLSFITLLLSASYSFLYAFLSQNVIYTAVEFFSQSLIPSYCIFNVILGLLLSIFGTYSTLPATKKKEKPIEEDFE